MYKSLRKTHPLLTIVNNSLVDLPSPRSISVWWNFGSLLGLCLSLQIATGFFLTIHYTPHVRMAFSRVVKICIDVNYGWFLRILHANGASFFFVCLFLHVGRGLYYGRYKFFHTWSVGVVMLFIVIGTAFMGYVLPWGQISFWGATVITNLISVVPYVGTQLVEFIWGGFSVSNATLTRFYSFHFILPFVILVFTIIHLMFLHETGSNNPLGLSLNVDKLPFHPYYSVKDLVGVCILYIILYVCLINPYLLGDCDNFIIANPLVTPPHIQPEWYFLFAYAILRSIPNKLGGVIALVMSLAVLFLVPLFINTRHSSYIHYPINGVIFWFYFAILLILSWLGAQPVEDPYIFISQGFTVLYFSYYLLNFLVIQIWDFILKSMEVSLL